MSTYTKQCVKCKNFNSCAWFVEGDLVADCYKKHDLEKQKDSCDPCKDFGVYHKLVERHKMKKFEYKRIYDKLSVEALNKLGDEGWEICGYAEICLSRVHYTYIFKRIKKDEK